MSPCVSVIVATRNRPRLLRLALESLERQTWRDFEVIVVDDGSEVAGEVGAAIPADSRFRLLRLPHSLGPGAARNRGFEEARGQFIAILDDDDIAIPERLERQRALLIQGASVGLTFSTVQWFRGDMEPTSVFPGALARGRWPTEPHEVFRMLYLESNKIPNTTVMFRRELLQRFRYPEWTPVGEDWYMFMQMAASGIEIKPLSAPLVWQRRDTRFPSLVQNRDYRLRSELEVLRRIRDWLREMRIRDFDHLHRRAIGNAYARQARMVSRFRGLGLAALAVCCDPTNGDGWQAAAEILGRAGKRALRWAWRS